VQVRRFRPGLDYTVASAGGMGAAVQLEATLCFVDCEGEAAEGAWGSDEVGGFQCYIAADEEATAAAETYKHAPIYAVCCCVTC
jgi:prolyl 3-hydroxylase /prolyl 3,4-dihydroxylase